MKIHKSNLTEPNFLFHYANVGVAPNTGKTSIVIYIKIKLWLSWWLKTDNDLSTKT